MELIYNQSELRLVRLCKKGDAKAQYKLYKLYVKGMYNLAVRMTRDNGLAEDIIQDAFIKAFSDIKRLNNERAFGGWMRKIVVNKCIDAIRNKKLVLAGMEALNEHHFEQAEEVDESVDAEMIHRLIKKLPDGAREILVLRALEGYKHAEIGEQLGISESTAKTQFFRAKQLLGKMINEEMYETGSGENNKEEALKA